MTKYYGKDLKDMGKTTKKVHWEGWALIIGLVVYHMIPM